MKKVLLVLAAVAAFASFSFAGETTPVKVSIFPKLGLPTSQAVHGLDLGLIATKVDVVKGVQLGWFYAGTRENMVGLQNGFVTSAAGITGLQYGFVNLADNMTGVQLGFINVADKMQGIQIGLINVIKNGVLPVFVIVNANF